MSSHRILHGRWNDRSRRATLRLEGLERRHPLAGNVTAELVGSTLRLTGDALGNEMLVASAPDGIIAVLGVGTTINGSPRTFLTTGKVTAITATFNGGDDAVGFGNSAADYANARLFAMLTTSPASVWSEDQAPQAPVDVAALQARIDEVAGGITTFSLPGSLTVTTGDGNDSVGIAGDVGGRVVVRLGAADQGNGLVIGGESTASRLGGGVTVEGGERNDLVAIGNVSVTGMVSAALGDGMNWMLVAGEADTPAIIDAFTYSGGANIDMVALAGDVTVRNDVRIVTAGQAAAKPHGGGAFFGNDDDTVDLLGTVRIRGSVSVITGGGNDAVSVCSLVGWVTEDGNDPVPVFSVAGSCRVGRELTISTGAGADVVSIGNTAVGRGATIDSGSNDDRVDVEAMQVGGSLFVRLRGGDDTLGIRNSTAFATFLDGGDGANSLSTDATTRTANRTMSIRRFRITPRG